MDTSTKPPVAMSIARAATALGVSVNHVYRLLEAGKLKEYTNVARVDAELRFVTGRSVARLKRQREAK